MVSKLPLLLNIFLAFTALALPRAVSIVRSDLYSHSWAGCQRRAFRPTNTLDQFEYVSVKFMMPKITPVRYPNSDVTFALSVGNPSEDESCNILMAGVKATVTNGKIEMYPVRGNNLNNMLRIQNVDGEGLVEPFPIEARDIFTLKIILDRYGGTVTIENHNNGWTAMAYIAASVVNPATQCAIDSQPMVIAKAVTGGYVPLAEFGMVTFYGFLVAHNNLLFGTTFSNLVNPPKCYDIWRQGSALLPYTSTDGRGDVTTVHNLNIEHLD